MSLNLTPDHRAKLVQLAREAIEGETNSDSSKARRLKRLLAKLAQAEEPKSVQQAPPAITQTSA
jgi:hypothetical protein